MSYVIISYINHLNYDIFTHNKRELMDIVEVEVNRNKKLK